MFIYVIENNLNGKIYVGQTAEEDPIMRWRNHLYNSKNTKCSMPVDSAIAKYGEENFSFDIIEYHSTKEELNCAETYWITYLRECLGKKFLYNIKDGGAIGTLPEESRIKIGETHKKRYASGIKHPKLGIPMSEDAKQKLSKINKENPSMSMLGKNHSEEAKKKMSEVKIHNMNNKKRKLSPEDDLSIIADYSTGNYTHRELAIKYGVGKTIIGDILNGRKYRKY